MAAGPTDAPDDAPVLCTTALPFHIVDVFTTGAASTGNQLLVVEDRADSLTDEAMQSIASEIGFAESAFVRSKDTVRIFTVDVEVPQAGHPIIGLSEIIGGPCRAHGKQLVLGTKKGPIHVESGEQPGSWFAMQDPPDWLGHASRRSVEPLLKSGAGHLVGDAYPIGSTCGLPYALVPVSSEASLDSLAIDPGAPPDAFQAQCTTLPNGLALYFYVHVAATTFRTRMFCHEGGMWIEDVATGSAAGPLACHLAPLRAVFTQGLQRRAEIYVHATRRENDRVQVGGSVVRVASGKWSVNVDATEPATLPPPTSPSRGVGLGGSRRARPPRWAWVLFGVAEPLVNFATGALLTAPGGVDLFTTLLFPHTAGRGVSHDPTSDPTVAALCRMYASCLLCFGLCQAFLWRQWRIEDDQTPSAVRAWSWLMLVPDLHHMLYAYGVYWHAHGRLDAACVAHYGIQGTLTLGRLKYLFATASREHHGVGPRDKKQR